MGIFNYNSKFRYFITLLTKWRALLRGPGGLSKSVVSRLICTLNWILIGVMIPLSL